MDSTAKAKGNVCSTIGKKDDSKTCPHFRKNLDQLKALPDEANSAVETFAKLVRKIPKEQVAAIGIAMLNERQTREQGFYFYERVYVRYRGRSNRNYTGNFMACYVLYATNSHVVFCDANGKSTITLPIKSVTGETSNGNKDCYRVKEFKKLRKEMEAQGRTVDPEVIIPTKKVPAELDEVIPTKKSLQGDVDRINAIYKASKKNDKARKAEKAQATLGDVARSILSGHVVDDNFPEDVETFGGLNLDDPFATKDSDKEGYDIEIDDDAEESSGKFSRYMDESSDDYGNEIMEC